jgi:hypothetical protein
MSYRFFAIPACNQCAAEADLNRLLTGYRTVALGRRLPAPTASRAAVFSPFTHLCNADGQRQPPL